MIIIALLAIIVIRHFINVGVVYQALCYLCSFFYLTLPTKLIR